MTSDRDALSSRLKNDNVISQLYYQYIPLHFVFQMIYVENTYIGAIE